jgi:hypothetical protein
MKKKRHKQTYKQHDTNTTTTQHTTDQRQQGRDFLLLQQQRTEIHPCNPLWKRSYRVLALLRD